MAEVNNGGDLVANTIRMVDENVSFKAVHATRGKVVRAEPIAALYEQKRIFHVGSIARERAEAVIEQRRAEEEARRPKLTPAKGSVEYVPGARRPAV